MVLKKESETLKRLRKEFIDAVDEFSKDGEKWLDFLDFSSQIDDYSFHEKVCVYLQNPNAVQIARYAEWDEFDCKLTLNAKRICLPDGKGGIFFVYDRGDIIGTPPKLWQFSETFDIINELKKIHGTVTIREFLTNEIHKHMQGSIDNLKLKAVEVSIVLIEMRYNIIVEGQRQVGLEGFNIFDSIKVGKAATDVTNEINNKLFKIIIEKDGRDYEKVHSRDRDRISIWNRDTSEPLGLGGSRSENGALREKQGQRLEERGYTMDDIPVRATLQPVRTDDNGGDIGRRGFQNAGEISTDDRNVQKPISQETIREIRLLGKGGNDEASNGTRKGNSGQRGDLPKPTNGESSAIRGMELSNPKHVSGENTFEPIRGVTEQSKIGIKQEEVSGEKDISSFLLQGDNKNQKLEKLDNFMLSDNIVIPDGQKAKFECNVAAIQTIKTIQKEDRIATAEEQKILAHYSGWGGISEAFDSNKENWKSEYNKLSELLSAAEYNAARASTLNAHYTSPVVVKAVYQALENFGFEGGNILEPSMATGVFFSAMPQELQRKSKLYGVELDILTGLMAKNLFPSADIQIKGFEQTDYQDNFFDVVVGNVPFGEYRLSDNRHKALIHDFFFLRALDKVKVGGIVALITSTGTLDKQNPSVRKKLAIQGDLIGAIRLPDNTFQQTANTKITTDIIFLQKRSQPLKTEPDWVYTGIYNSDKCSNAIINQYFIENPEKMLGELQMVSSRFGKLTHVLKLQQGTNLEELLSNAVSTMEATIQSSSVERRDEKITYISADESIKNYTFTNVNGDIYYRDNSVLIPYEGSVKNKERVELLCAVRTDVRAVIEAQIVNDFSQEAFEKAMKNLNSSYDKFHKKFGAISLSVNASAFAKDSDVYLLCSLENMAVNEDTGEKTYSKGDMFFKQTIKAKEQKLIFENAIDAFNVTMAEKGMVDLEYIESICTKTRQEVLDELELHIFIKPPEDDGTVIETVFCSKEEYLCGDVKKKLAQAIELAKKDERFEKHVAALTAVQPKKLSASDINVRLSSHWIEEKYVNRFIYELLEVPNYCRGTYNRDIYAKYYPINNEWTIKNKTAYRGIAVIKTFGTSRVSAFNLIELILNQKIVTVRDAVDDDNGKTKYVYNHEETIAARQKQTLINEKFKDWIFQDPIRRVELVEKYNKLFNSMIPRNFDGSYIKLENANPEIKLRPHQLNSVSRIRLGDNTLLAHVVGSGKTFTMIAGGMEQLRLGTASKLMYVVPNHLISDFAANFLKLYPTANVIVTTEKDFEKKHRQKFISRIITSDVDAVVMGHSQYERIAVSPKRKEIEIRRELASLESAISSVERETGQRASVKQLEGKKAKLKEKLNQLLDGSKKDQQIFFEELGVDSIFIDEAHEFKNGAVFSKMQNVGGVSNANSLKASDMLAKCRYIHEIKGSIIFATGTPISNAISELYVMQRYLQEDRLSSVDINHFDEWISIFGETTTSVELKPEGTGYRTVTKISNYYNVPELMNIFYEVADIQTSEMLDLPTPKIVGGAAKVIACEPSEELLDFMDESIFRAENIRSGAVRPEEDNMLKLTNDARKAGADMRLYYSNAQFDPEGKISKCCENIVKHYIETSDTKGTQLVFSDIGTPNKIKFNVYDEVKRILIERGVKAEEIAFIHDYKTQMQKQELYADMRSGSKRVLIGSTKKCGAGTNVQDRLIALHHIDCPYRPSDIEQREGRILRQGNMFKEVNIYRYVTKKSFDAYLWVRHEVA